MAMLPASLTQLTYWTDQASRPSWPIPSVLAVNVALLSVGILIPCAQDQEPIWIRNLLPDHDPMRARSTCAAWPFPHGFPVACGTTFAAAAGAASAAQAVRMAMRWFMRNSLSGGWVCTVSIGGRERIL